MTAKQPARRPPVDLLHDFGGDGPTVHLAHANGFPPGSYRLLAKALTDHHHVIALPSRPLWPGSQPADIPTWQPMASDMIEGLDRLGLRGIVGIGHSLGGVLTLWASIQRPDLFQAVVLIEPVILPPSWLLLIRLARKLGLEQHQPLVQGALRRRRSWPSRTACFEHYRQKPLFATWSNAALEDYVESGTQAGIGTDPERPAGQVELTYPPAWEAHIFATTPTGIWRDLPHLGVPALVIRGEHSRTFLPSAQARLARRLPQVRTLTIPGAGHLVPMEKPGETGRAILAFLDSVPSTPA